MKPESFYIKTIEQGQKAYDELYRRRNLLLDKRAQMTFDSYERRLLIIDAQMYHINQSVINAAACLEIILAREDTEFLNNS